MKLLLTIIVFAVSCLTYADDNPAQKQVTKYLESMTAKDMAAVLDCFSFRSEQEKQHMTRVLSRMSEGFADGSTKNEVLSGHIIDNCAVVLINESMKKGKPAFDIDPFYLKKFNGSWKISSRVTDPLPLITSKEENDIFTKLKAWYKQQKATLIKQHSNPK